MKEIMFTSNYEVKKFRLVEENGQHQLKINYSRLILSPILLTAEESKFIEEAFQGAYEQGMWDAKQKIKEALSI